MRRPILALTLLSALVAGAAPSAAQDGGEPRLGTPHRAWSLPLFRHWSVRPYAATRMAAADGIAYVGTREGRLFAVEAVSGDIRWARWLGARVSGGPSLGRDGRVYVGTDGGKVWCLDPGTGETVWKVGVSSEVMTAPTLAAGMVFVRTADDFLWALRGADGGTRWSYNVEGRSLALRGASRPVFRRGTVFTGFSTGELVALKAGDGSPRWREAIATSSGRTELERMVDVDASPVVVDGTVIAAAYQGGVVALEAASGQQLWKREISVHNDLAVAGSMVFVTTAKGTVMALDRDGGGTMWTQKGLADAGALSPPVVAGETVVVGDGEGRLTWLRRETGEVAGQLDLGPSGIHGPPLVLDGGWLLALTDQGVLNRVRLR